MTALHLPTVVKLQTAAVATGNGTAMNVEGYLSAVISVVSSVAMSGGTTVNFEASVDGTTYVSLLAHQGGTTSIVTTTTSDGDFRVNVTGYKFLRARISGYSAGTTTITAYAVAAAGHSNAVGATLQAGTALAGVMIAPPQTGVLYNGTTAVTPATGIGNVAASQTDSTGTSFPAGVTAKIIRVTAATIVVSGAMNVTFNTKPAGAGTAISPLYAFAANGGLVLDFNPNGWFDTSSGDGLTVTTGAGGTAGILVRYVQF